MKTLHIKLGDFEGTLHRVPKDMEETANVIAGVLQKYAISVEHGKKEIEIYIVNEKLFWDNGKRNK